MLSFILAFCLSSIHAYVMNIIIVFTLTNTFISKATYDRQNLKPDLNSGREVAYRLASFIWKPKILLTSVVDDTYSRIDFSGLGDRTNHTDAAYLSK